MRFPPFIGVGRRIVSRDDSSACRRAIARGNDAEGCDEGAEVDRRRRCCLVRCPPSQAGALLHHRRRLLLLRFPRAGQRRIVHASAPTVIRPTRSKSTSPALPMALPISATAMSRCPASMCASSDDARLLGATRRPARRSAPGRRIGHRQMQPRVAPHAGGAEPGTACGKARLCIAVETALNRCMATACRVSL